MLWVATHLPQLGLEVFRPAPLLASGKAVVLVADQRLALVNEIAARAGIRRGSNLATAYSLQADLEHHMRDQALEQERLQDLVVTAYEFSPAVSMALPSALLLEVAGSLKLFGGLPNLLRQLRRRIAQRGHVVQLGVAHTPHAALALAKADKACAWTDFPQPDEIQQIAEKLLLDTPVACGDFMLPVIERLANMGIRSLGELLELPRHELGTRFDAEFMTYLSKLAGTIPDLRPWEEPLEQFVVERHLLEPLRSKDALLQPMTQLLEELDGWLQAKFLGVRCLRWWFATFERTGAHMELSLAEPQSDVEAMLALTELKYENLELPEDVMTIRLEAVEVESLAQRSQLQRDLFGARQRQGNAPTELLDRLAVRLGPQALKSLNQLDDHRPEYAWSPVFPTETAELETTASVAGRRPLWLLEPPQRVQPKHFEVLTCQERIEGGWWDEPLARDYFVARHGSGTICWLYQDATGWYQHGYFA